MTALVDRDGLVAFAVGVGSLALMARHAASVPERWPWVWLTWASAVPFLALLLPAVQGWARAGVEAHPNLRAWVPASLVALGVSVALASGTVAGWRIAVWPVCIAAAVVAVGNRRAVEHTGGRLLAAALALGVAAGIWDSTLKIVAPGGTRLGLTFLTSTGLALFLYCAVRPMRSLDVRLGLTWRELGAALGAVLVLAGVAVPVGFLIGYLEVNPRWQGWSQAATRILGLIVFVGIPEEVLFRGLIQEGLSRMWTPRAGWLVGSLLFGLSHITKPTGLPRFADQALVLNWRYALLAALAGLAYGWVYRRTGKVSAAAVTHGAANWLWSTWLIV